MLIPHYTMSLVLIPHYTTIPVATPVKLTSRGKLIRLSGLTARTRAVRARAIYIPRPSHVAARRLLSVTSFGCNISQRTPCVRVKQTSWTAGSPAILLAANLGSLRLGFDVSSPRSEGSEKRKNPLASKDGDS